MEYRIWKAFWWKLNTSYSQNSFDNKSIVKERDSFKSEKEELKKKNQEILREHQYLKERVKKLEHELKSKKELEKKFNPECIVIHSCLYW